MGSDLPKQYLCIGGRALLELSVEALLAVPEMAAVIVSLHPEDQFAYSLAGLDDPRVVLVSGGAERADSVLAGLRAVPGDPDDWVLVHDAARPCVNSADIQRLVRMVRESGIGGILAEPVVDTIKQASPEGRVERTLDRRTLWRAQTPQMFALGQLREALSAVAGEQLPVTDEASAMELTGHPVQLVAGPGSNLKVTLPGDLELAAWYLARRGDTQ